MNEKRRKTEPPLYIDMDTDEALARFIQTDPREADELAKQAKAARGPPEPRRRSKVKNDKGEG